MSETPRFDIPEDGPRAERKLDLKTTEFISRELSHDVINHIRSQLDRLGVKPSSEAEIAALSPEDLDEYLTSGLETREALTKENESYFLGAYDTMLAVRASLDNFLEEAQQAENVDK